jgi:fructose-1,6-bisphosphatase I
MIRESDRSPIELEHFLRNRSDDDVGETILAIARGAKQISSELSSRVGTTEQLNPFGEKQSELDVFSNDHFAKLLIETGCVGMITSEEMEKPISHGESKNRLSVGMDPLDGSSNITTNNPLGSIFGIWRGSLPQKGRDQIASAFVTYGPTLSLTFQIEGAVHQFIESRRSETYGEFVLAYKSMRLPEKAEVYGFGGLRSEWIAPVLNFVEELERRGMKLRYGGTFIGDYNQVIHRGGIFSYPALKNKPNGKFRLTFEAAPVSLITEMAGGYSSDGMNSILEREPKGIHDTTPFYTGSLDLVRELESMISSA